jgi:hypothetical protein
MITGVTILRKVEDTQGNILALVEDMGYYAVVFCEYNFFKETYSKEEIFVTLFQDEAEEIYDAFFLDWANPNNTMKDWYDMMECY